jgi:transcriptional regulator with XRE-family HTH domain
MVMRVSILGTTIRKAREAKNLTQDDLAQRAGVKASQISRLETGDRTDPYFSTMVGIAKALGLSLDRLAGIGLPGDTAATPPIGLQGLIEESARKVPDLEKSLARVEKTLAKLLKRDLQRRRAERQRQEAS